MDLHQRTLFPKTTLRSRANQAIKFAPCGRRTIVPRAVYGGCYAPTGSGLDITVEGLPRMALGYENPVVGLDITCLLLAS